VSLLTEGGQGANGLAVVIWSYPRGGELDQGGRDRASTSAPMPRHIAALLGAHIIKVKPPTDHLDAGCEPRRSTKTKKIDVSTAAARMEARACRPAFNGKRIVVFSGGEAKDLDGLYHEIRAIRDGGGNGSIIGRNTFQRPRADALAMLDQDHLDLSGQDVKTS
jgi:class I fructose-bisphosphate aldolase